MSPPRASPISVTVIAPGSSMADLARALEALPATVLSAPLEHADAGALGTPDVIIVAADLDESAFGLRIEGLLTPSPTRPPVLIIGGGTSPEAVRRAVRLRPLDLLDRDPPLEAVREALKGVEPRAPKAEARTIGFLSPRGGVGVTSLAINAAWLIAQKRGSEVCVIDAKFGAGACAVTLDCEPMLRLPPHFAVERLDAQMLEAFLAPKKHDVRLLAAPSGQDEAALRQMLPKLLEVAATRFSHVVLDLPFAGDPWLRPILSRLDDLFLAFDLSVPGLKLAKAADQTLSDMRIEHARLIANRLPRARAGALTPADISRHLGRSAATIHEDAEAALEAADKGGPIGAARPDSRLAREYRDSVSALLGQPQRSPTFVRSILKLGRS